MTIKSYSSPISHGSDAAFRAYGLEFSNGLQSAGVIKTPDTGQINWSTVLRPAANVVAGYETFQLNDPLQPTAPVFFKLEYATAGYAKLPQIYLTVGTGTNGSGTLTGVISTRVAMCSSTTNTSADLANTVDGMPTFICAKNGFVGVIFKAGAGYGGEPNAVMFFMIGRTANDDGTESTDGIYVITRSGGNTANGSAAAGLQFLRFSDGNVSTRSINFCLIPGAITSSKVNGVAQAFKTYAMTPRQRPLLHVLHVLASEFPNNTATDAMPLGSTTRHYMSGGQATSYAGSVGDSNHTLAMLWED